MTNTYAEVCAASTDRLLKAAPRMFELLCAALAMLEDEEPSVQEEHKELWADLEAMHRHIVTGDPLG